MPPTLFWMYIKLTDLIFKIGYIKVNCLLLLLECQIIHWFAIKWCFQNNSNAFLLQWTIFLRSCCTTKQHFTQLAPPLDISLFLSIAFSQLSHLTIAQCWQRSIFYNGRFPLSLSSQKKLFLCCFSLNKDTLLCNLQHMP